MANPFHVKGVHSAHCLTLPRRTADASGDFTKRCAFRARSPALPAAINPRENRPPECGAGPRRARSAGTLKDTRRGPGWEQAEVVSGCPGLGEINLAT